MMKRFIDRTRRVIERAFGLDSFGDDLSYGPLTGLIAGMGSGGPGLDAKVLKTILTMNMPGTSYAGPIELSDEESALAERLDGHVRTLACDIGIRNTRRIEKLNATADYIEAFFRSCNLSVNSYPYETSDGFSVRNIEAVCAGTTSAKPLIVGAHYDTVESPGADDNATAVAGLLEAARSMASSTERTKREVRFVAFTCEEPPYFFSTDMGSRVYAKNLKDTGTGILGMICLEMLGFFSDEPGSQRLPAILKPIFDHDRGDFIAFLGNNPSREFLKHVVGCFREHAEIPSEGLAAPSVVEGIDFSDHSSFWHEGYPAVMVTDTAFMRNPHYHTYNDTVDTLDRTRFTKTVTGLIGCIRQIADTAPKNYSAASSPKPAQRDTTTP